MTIETSNKRLQDLLSKSQTSDLLRSAAAQLLTLFSTDISGSGLVSPYKQVFHLLGLMLATDPEPACEPIDTRRWKEIQETLNEVFQGYALVYFPNKGELITEEWQQAREVAMPAFLEYFNTFRWLHRDHTLDRISSLFARFDQTIKDETGLTSQQMQDMVFWVEEQCQSSLGRIGAHKQAADKERERFLIEAEAQKLNVEEMRAKAKDDPVHSAHQHCIESFNNMFSIDLSAFQSRFSGDDVNRFMELFSSHRGQFKDYFYPTEENPAELRPLFIAEDDRVYCPSPGIVLLALLRNLEKMMGESPEAASFFKHRDKFLEDKVASLFERWLPEGLQIYRNVYETPDGQFEHDIVISIQGTYLIVECKATQRKEPWRDPDKAYVRILHAFRSDRGIQKACDQAAHLRRRLVSDEKVILYDQKGHIIDEIQGPAQEVFSVAVTLDSFGIIATNLALLLEKEPTEPFPWAVSVSDLETILGGFSHVEKTFEDVLKFLRDRSKLHGIVLSTDELEFAGVFLRYGNFDKFLSQKDAKIFLGHEMSDIFDEIHYEQLGIEMPKKRRPEGGPVMTDLREESGKILRERDLPDLADLTQIPKVGRNDPCPCGSGLKYKRCHGK